MSALTAVALVLTVGIAMIATWFIYRASKQTKE